jgi:hypothetical protein
MNIEYQNVQTLFYLYQKYILSLVSGGFAYFVVDLWECFVAGQSFSHLVIQSVVKHLPEFISGRVRVSIQHLKTATNICCKT